MTKALRKVIMIRSVLKNCRNKTLSDKNWSLCKTQRNFYTKFFMGTKKRSFFKKLSPKLVSDNKNFLHTVKPDFSDEDNFSKKIEKDCITSDDR